MSDTSVLTLIENTGIQDYIFASNNLAVNIGASELVERVTQDWLFEKLPGPNNLGWHEGRLSFDSETFEANSLNAEVIYCGGGNALILFRTEALALKFTQDLTTHVLCRAPNLQVVVAHQPFDLNGDVLFSEALDLLRKEGARRKYDRKISAPLAGLGVTAACIFTGQPAAEYRKLNERDSLSKYISAEVAAKLDAKNDAKERLNSHLKVVRRSGFEFIEDFEYFGTQGESSYIAVVHADGNGMGKRFGNYLKPFRTPAQNRAAIEALRKFSVSIQDISGKALHQTVQLLIDSLDGDAWMRQQQGANHNSLKVELSNKLLPFRPLVFGGDDVTFITDGRLGLALAKAYLEACSRQNLADGQPLYSRAGVAIVKTHFPFSRAYDLAEKLAASVKDAFKEDYPKVTGIDWHFATSGVIQDLKTVRKNEWVVSQGQLEMRPLCLEARNREWRTWKNFSDLVDIFQTDEEWCERRNKLKALREALRAGPEAVKQFNQYYLDGQGLPILAGFSDLAQTGWYQKRCGYFDAIEAMDFYIPLEGKRS